LFHSPAARSETKEMSVRSRLAFRTPRHFADKEAATRPAGFGVRARQRRFSLRTSSSGSAEMQGTDPFLDVPVGKQLPRDISQKNGVRKICGSNIFDSIFLTFI
jgi:hypothetical protein